MNPPGFILPSDTSKHQGHHHPSSAPPAAGPPPYSYPQQYPQYPTHQQHPVKPEQPYPTSYQPFPGPIQNQPAIGATGQPMPVWYANADFQTYLMNATSFHVKQKYEMLEILVGWEAENKYTVKDQSGNKIFFVGENSNFLGRQCFGKRRSFHLSVRDKSGSEVLVFERGLDCACCCGLCCPDQLVVKTGNGQQLGTVNEIGHCFTPKFAINDVSGRTHLIIEGPMFAFSCLGAPVVFKITTPNGVSVGTISKEWGGLVRELFTDKDYFSISFNQNLDPSIKAICLGALFLIDFEYFESGPSGNQGGRRAFS